MRAYSYADPVVGTAKLILESKDSEIEALLQMASDDPTDVDFKIGIFNWAWQNHRSLVIHEWAHILQVAAYPYLFLRAVRKARIMSGPSGFFFRHRGKYPLPLADFQLTPEWQMSNLIGTTPIRVRFTEDRIETQAVLHGSIRRGLISEHALVEEDATIFQYRALIGARGTGASYRNWLRETGGYSSTFLILANQFGDDAALNMIPMLTRIAFQTTRPTLAFAQTLGTIVGSGIHLEDADEIPIYEPFLLDNLVKILGDADVQSLPFTAPELMDPIGVISTKGFDHIVSNGKQLPVWPLANQSRREGPPDSSEILGVLRSPWETFIRHSNEVPPRLYPFLPPVFMVRPAHPDFRYGWTVLMISPLLGETPFPGIPDVTYMEWVKEVFRAQEIWKPIMDGSALPNPRCHHHECPVHRTALCYGWFPIPDDHRDCEFHDFIQRTTGHRVADDGSTLIAIDDQLRLECDDV